MLVGGRTWAGARIGARAIPSRSDRPVAALASCGASYMMSGMLARKMTVYGDLNCPFCYALEERLVTRQVQPHCEWRLVEHAPLLPHEPAEAKPTELGELVRELEDLSERAPEVVIGPPKFRPNSGLA